MLLFSPTLSRLPAICSSHLGPFSLTLSSIMLSLFEDQRNAEWVDRSTGFLMVSFYKRGKHGLCWSPGGALGGFRVCVVKKKQKKQQFLSFTLRFQDLSEQWWSWSDKQGLKMSNCLWMITVGYEVRVPLELAAIKLYWKLELLCTLLSHPLSYSQSVREKGGILTIHLLNAHAHTQGGVALPAVQ